MKKIKLFALLLIASLLLTGCPEKRELEDLGIINAMGIDVEGDDQIKANFVMFQFEAQSPDVTKVVSGQADTPTGAVNNANYEANFLLEFGKIQIDLFGLEAAKKGIAPYLDMLNRNPNTPDTMYLAISKTTAGEILKMQEENIAMNIGQYIHGVIDNSSTSPDHFPKMTLQKFMRYYKDIGRDPILPMFEILSDGMPKITSIAIMNGDKYVGHISIDNRELFNINYGRVKQEWVEVSIPTEPFKSELHDWSVKKEENIHMAISILKSKSKIKLMDKKTLKYEHSIQLNASLVDSTAYDDLSVEDPKILKKVEKEIEKYFKKRYENLLNELQDFNSDPLGYGEIYRQNHRGKKLTDKEWRILYPDIDVEFKLDVKLLYHGETI